MIQETILYGPRDYPLGLACDWLREIASGTSATFRVLLWTNPKGFDVEKTRYGEREIELGYRPVEEDFLNEFQATGDRWRWERASNSDELQRFLGGEEFNAKSPRRQGAGKTKELLSSQRNDCQGSGAWLKRSPST